MVEFLSLRRPTKVSQLLQNLTAPPYGLPRQVLPGWSQLPLHTKLPLLKCPFKKINFRRSGLAESNWQPNIEDFAAYDPNLYQFRFDYDPLSDPHLRKFFRQLVFKERIVYHRLVDCNTYEVLCGLNEFNIFRSYLYQLQLNEIRRRIRIEDLEERERNWLKKTENTIRKYLEKEKFEAMIPDRREKVKRLQRARYLLVSQSIQRYFNRLRCHYLTRQKQIQELRDKKFLETSMGFLKRKKLNETERLRAIRLCLKSRDKFLKHELNLSQMNLAKQEAFRQKSEETWNRRLHSREVQNQLNAKLLEQHNRMIQKNVEKRLKKMNEVQEKVQQQYQSSRANQIRRRYEHYDRNLVKDKFYTAYKKLGRKRRKHSRRRSTKSSGTSLSFNESDRIEKAIIRMKKHTTDTAVDQSYDMNDHMATSASSMSVLETAKEILQMVIETPDPLLPDDDHVLNNTKNRVIATFQSIRTEIYVDLQKIFHCIDTNKSNKKPKKKVGMNAVPSKESSQKHVQIGEQKIVEVPSSYQKLGVLKSTNGRPPTPVASLDSIVAVILATDPEEPPEVPTHDYDHFDLMHMTKTQKILVERNLILLKKLIKQAVGRQTLAAIDFKGPKIRARHLKKVEIDSKARDRVISKLSKTILKLPIDEDQMSKNLVMAANMITYDVLNQFKLEVIDLAKHGPGIEYCDL